LDDSAQVTSAAGFRDQLLRGCWPIRMPLVLEIFAQGPKPQVHSLRPGDARRHPNSQVVTLVLEFDRDHVRNLMLEQVRSPLEPGHSRLVDLIGLIFVDRPCFLATAAAHFAEALRQTDVALRRDRCLFSFVRELHEFDGDVVGDLAAETMRLDRAAGERLRTVLLDLLDHPQARDHLGWLAAAALSERLEDL
jgi:hypothetical protein